MNSTTEYLDVDGFSLQTFGWNIETKGGSRVTLPAMKSGNVAVPNRRGERWVPKQLEARTIQLQMWCQGSDADGKRTTVGAVRQYDLNMAAIRAKLFVYRRQMVLTRRFRDPFGTLIAVTALGEYVGGLEPQMTGPARSTFTVDIRLADPLWYGALETLPLAAAGTPANFTIKGDHPTSRVVMTVPGTATNPKLTDNTNARWMQLTASIPTADTATIDVDQFAAASPALGALSHRITRDAAGYWFELTPGLTSLVYSRTAGTGAAATVKYFPAYL